MTLVPSLDKRGLTCTLCGYTNHAEKFSGGVCPRCNNTGKYRLQAKPIPGATWRGNIKSEPTVLIRLSELASDDPHSPLPDVKGFITVPYTAYLSWGFKHRQGEPRPTNAHVAFWLNAFITAEYGVGTDFTENEVEGKIRRFDAAVKDILPDEWAAHADSIIARHGEKRAEMLLHGLAEPPSKTQDIIIESRSDYEAMTGDADADTDEGTEPAQVHVSPAKVESEQRWIMVLDRNTGKYKRKRLWVRGLEHIYDKADLEVHEFMNPPENGRPRPGRRQPSRIKRIQEKVAAAVAANRDAGGLLALSEKDLRYFLRWRARQESYSKGPVAVEIEEPPSEAPTP